MSVSLARRDFLYGAGATLGALASGSPARAQAWPSQAIKIVCGFAAGGLTDQISRVYGDHLSRRLGQAVIVENKPGGQGSIAAQSVKLAPADGYTLMTTISGTMFTNRILYKTLSYDADKPVILHELMHAYHDQRLSNGFRNAEIQRLFEQARTGGRFPASAYMLSNVAEYFAMMSSVYLHGAAARDPLTRQAIREKQPDCYEWLVKEFGPR